MKEERFLYPGKSPQWGGDRPGWRMSFGSQKESAATSLQKANWRVTQGPALPSMRDFSVSASGS